MADAVASDATGILKQFGAGHEFLLDGGSSCSQHSLAIDVVAKILSRFQESPDLGGVRDPEASAKFHEAERASWQALWAEVASVEKRLRPMSP
jgi:hypothetical protein